MADNGTIPLSTPLHRKQQSSFPRRRITFTEQGTYAGINQSKEKENTIEQHAQAKYPQQLGIKLLPLRTKRYNGVHIQTECNVGKGGNL